MTAIPCPSCAAPVALLPLGTGICIGCGLLRTAAGDWRPLASARRLVLVPQ